MESMDNFRERFEALEQQTEQLRQQTQTLEAQTHTLARQARWWRGIACGGGLLGLVSLPLQSGTAAAATGLRQARRIGPLAPCLSITSHRRGRGRAPPGSARRSGQGPYPYYVFSYCNAGHLSG